ncbi:MAG: hypothetical protein HZB44_08735 [Actinobacteria bacterium]|nr:hypothetical protein [Actinomycetota bacterium]
MNRSNIKKMGFIVGIVVLICLLMVLNLIRMFYVPDSDLPGKYMGKHGKGEDTIEIRVDGTYEHLYREKPNGELMSNEGSWKRDSGEGITFLDYQDFTNLQGGDIGEKLMEPHFQGAGVSKAFFGNTVRLGFSSEIPNYFYEKQD